MLDKWKNRIKKLFQQNDDIEEMKEFEHVLRNDYDRQQNQQDLKARVTYQYPKQKSFRFPVIPDQMIEEERTTKKAEDRIVQKRRSSGFQQEKEKNSERGKRNERQPRREPIQKNEKENVSQSESAQASLHNNLINKTSKEPFQVSEVPSPIYGFQRREERESRIEVPAYIRREESKENTLAEKKQQAKGEAILEEQSEEINKEQQNKESVSPLNEVEIKRIEPVIIENDNKQEGINEIAATIESIIEKVEQSTPSYEEVKEDANSVQRKQDVPYNVFKTSSDKQNLLSKQTEQTDSERIEYRELEESPRKPKEETQELEQLEQISSIQSQPEEPMFNLRSEHPEQTDNGQIENELGDESSGVQGEETQELEQLEQISSIQSQPEEPMFNLRSEHPEQTDNEQIENELGDENSGVQEEETQELEQLEQISSIQSQPEEPLFNLRSEHLEQTDNGQIENGLGDENSRVQEEETQETEQLIGNNSNQNKPLIPYNVMMTPIDKRKLSEKQLEQKNEEIVNGMEVKQEEEVQKQDKPEESNSNKSVFPFNVIMTPSDKRNLNKKQTEQRNVEESTENNLELKPIMEDEENSKTDLIQQPIPVKEIPYHLLDDPVVQSDDNQAWVEEQQHLLEETLKHFKVRANVVKATQGPAVTRFEVQPELGVKVSKIKNLSDDLKLNMAAKDIRIEAPIPGKNTVGIEIPNQQAQTVGLQEIFDTDVFKESESPLTVALGLSIEGEPKVTDIQKMPHGLIAGATGSGKSVCINTMLVSLLYKSSHEDVRILLIDPKMVELAPYNGIPHLITPVITDVKAATQSLKWAVEEMESRYEKFVHEGVRNIKAYNKKILQQKRAKDKMPFIVIVIDELADLMMTAPHDVEDSISRIAQKARACGIHLILATQRPSVDVITGLIKANIPTRIAFSVSSQIDSRTIIDVSGAEKLLGKGDMLFVENGTGKSVRLQGPFVSDDEIERVTNYARSIAEPEYLFEQEDLLNQIHVDEEEDELLEDVIDFILQQNSASTSMLQRRFKVGYNRAARLMDTLEYKGIISGQNGSKPREVLISKKQEDM